MSRLSLRRFQSKAVQVARAVVALGLGVVSAACTAQATATGGAPRPEVEQREGALLVPGDSPLRALLAVETIQAQLIRHQLEVPATIEADPSRMAKISPPLTGRVVKLFVHLGDTVRQGAPLFALDSADLVAAESDYLKANSADAQAARGLARARDLREHGVGAEKELEQAQTDRELASSELDRAGMRLRLLGMEPGDVGKPLIVRAPVPGRVIDLATAPGQYQNDPAAVLMTVADLSSLWVTASVPEKDIQRVAVGETAEIELSAYPGRRLAGQVQFIGEVLAPETRSVKVRIQLENADGRFKPGMFARVRLHGDEAPELLVPAAALQLRGDQSFVLVERAPWTFERRPVVVGEALLSGTCIASGLKAGERVVTNNTILLP